MAQLVKLQCRQAKLGACFASPAEWVVASGSLPRGVPEDFFARLAAPLAAQGRKLVLDTSGAALKAALAAGDKAAATTALAAAQPEMQRGVAKGVLHRNTASRKFSRLTKRVAALA